MLLHEYRILSVQKLSGVGEMCWKETSDWGLDSLRNVAFARVNARVNARVMSTIAVLLSPNAKLLPVPQQCNGARLEFLRQIGSYQSYRNALIAQFYVTTKTETGVNDK